MGSGRVARRVGRARRHQPLPRAPAVQGHDPRSALDIASAMDAVGGEFNAFTEKEHTCFYATVLDRDLPLAIDIVADVVVDATVTAQDVDVERRVVLEEIAMRDDDPADLVHDEFATALFGDIPIGRRSSAPRSRSPPGPAVRLPATTTVGTGRRDGRLGRGQHRPRRGRPGARAFAGHLDAAGRAPRQGGHGPPSRRPRAPRRPRGHRAGQHRPRLHGLSRHARGGTPWASCRPRSVAA